MGLLQRVLRRRHARPAVGAPSGQPQPHAMAQLRRSALVEFMTAREAFESYDHLLSQSEDLGIRSDDAARVLRESWDARVNLAQQNVDRDASPALRRAFAALEATGIIARENYGSTEQEGRAQMIECEATRERYTAARGYVFFDRRDADRLVDGPGDMCLHFGALGSSAHRGTPEHALDDHIGREVVSALRQVGFTPRLSGRDALVITDVAWYAMPGGA